jgi:hypothetical protein
MKSGSKKQIWDKMPLFSLLSAGLHHLARSLQRRADEGEYKTVLIFNAQNQASEEAGFALFSARFHRAWVY